MGCGHSFTVNENGFKQRTQEKSHGDSQDKTRVAERRLDKDY